MEWLFLLPMWFAIVRQSEGEEIGLFIGLLAWIGIFCFAFSI